MEINRTTRIGRLLSRTCAVLACVLVAALTSAVPASAGSQEIGCGDTLTASVTLTADLTCADQGLRIAADHMTLDLGGHTFTGAGVGILGSSVTVKNGTIVAINGTGVSVSRRLPQRSGSLTLSDVRVVGKDPKSGRVSAQLADLTMEGSPETCTANGVAVSAASIRLSRCTVHGHLYIDRVAHATVESNILTDGYATTEVTGVGFAGNVFDNFPVIIDERTGGGGFTNNVFKNSEVAFRMNHGGYKRAWIRSNLFINNSIGLLSERGFSNLEVAGNTFKDNRDAGILVNQASVAPGSYPVADNDFSGNGTAPSGITDLGGNPVQGGIHIFAGADPQPNITLTRNTGRDNAGFLIWAQPNSVVDGGGNQAPCGPQPHPNLTCVTP